MHAPHQSSMVLSLRCDGSKEARALPPRVAAATPDLELARRQTSTAEMGLELVGKLGSCAARGGK